MSINISQTMRILYIHWIHYLLLIGFFICLENQVIAQWQGSQTNYANNTELIYVDECTGVTTLEFFMKENFFRCQDADVLECLDVYSDGPGTSGDVLLASIRERKFVSNQLFNGTYAFCGEIIDFDYTNLPGQIFFTNPDLCRKFSRVSYVGGVQFETIGFGNGMKGKFTFSDLPDNLFGNETRLRLVGNVNGYGGGGSFSFDFTIADGDQGSIQTPTGLRLSNEGCNRIEVQFDPIASPDGCEDGWVVEVYRKQKNTSASFVKIGETQTSPYLDTATNLLPNTEYEYQLRSRWNQSQYRINYPPPTTTKSILIPRYQGTIEGKVASLSGGGVGGVTVTATLDNPNSLGCTPFPVAPTVVSDVTADADGTYRIADLFVGRDNHPTDAMYTVVASRAGRTIGPASRTVMLSSSMTQQFSVDFTDSSAVAISGIVTDFKGCGLGGAEVSVIANQNILDVTTMEDGSYTLQLPGSGNYDVRSTYEGEVLINNQTFSALSTPGIDFTHTLKDTLRGFVGAGCEEFIGTAEVSARIGNCPVDAVTTDGSGFYEMIVPTRDVTIKVTDITLIPNSDLVKADVLAAISADSLVTVDSTTTYDIIYRRPLTIGVTGLPPASCADIPYPILEQGREYILDINIWETLNICRSDTGSITINNFISGVSNMNQIDTTFGFSDGRARYIFQAGEPMLTGDHVKDLNITVTVGNRTQMLTVEAVVTGGRTRGETFITAPVDLPLMILRDPPGDQSYSFFEENNSFSYVQSFDYSTETQTKAWIKAKAGAKIFKLKLWASVQGSYDVRATTSNSEENVVTFSYTNSFRTSDSQQVVGSKGDAYVGAGINFAYSLADILEFDLLTCSLQKDTSLWMSPEGFATNYVYTEGHVLDVIIPQIKRTLAIAIATDQPEEVINRERNALDVWQQALELNRELKEVALSGTIDSLKVENYSFDANIEDATRTVTTSRSQSRTINFKTAIDVGVATELGLEFDDVSGGSGGVDFNFRTSVGASERTTVSTETTMGYVYNDDDEGDFISFDVGIDPVYGSPVFGNVRGETSCPHEGVTVRRDDMEFSVIGSPIRNVPQGQSTAFFDLEIGNIGQSITDQSRSFTIDVSNENIPAGITITSGAGDFPRTITIDNGKKASVPVNIRRSAGSPAFTLEGREFIVTPECSEDGFKKSVYLSVYFVSPCSDLEMPIPSDDWLVTQANSNLLNLVVDDYDLATTIDEIALEYGDADDESWALSDIILTGAAISTSPNGTSVNWDVSDLPDGAYKIRWRLTCNGTTFNYSPRKFGVIDRSAPIVVGRPQPSDDNFTSGDEISVLLDQMIDCNALSQTDISFTSQPDNTDIPYQLSCEGDKITILPLSDLSKNIGATYQVEIIKLQDELGNISGDTIIWDFIVNDNDADGDGISDTFDKCPGGNDFFDTDLGGVPDDCDCDKTSAINEFVEDDDCDNILNGADMCPEVADVALNFDGIDDYLLLPNESDFDITDSITVQAWIKVDNFDIPNQAIVTKGDNTWRIARNFMSSTISFALSGVWQIDGTIEVDDNQWHHVAGVFDGSVMSLYIDGVLDVSINRAGSIITSDDPVIIGSNYQGGPSRFFEGSIDDVIIWNRGLTHAEILESMAAPVDPNESGLVAYFSFNDNTACSPSTQTTVMDEGPLANNGTLMNFSLSDDCNSNWTSGTNKVKLCKGCEDILQLTSSLGILDGTYAAKDQIIVMPGARFITSKTVNLSAPVIDFGVDNEIPSTANLNVDNEGCEDLPFSNKVFVNASANGSNNGTSWANAFINLQDALDNVAAGQEIWIAKGTYHPDKGSSVTEGDRSASFVMKNDVTIAGGFAGTEPVDFDIHNRDLVVNETILSGDIGVAGERTDNSYHVIANDDNGLDASAKLDGVTVSGGYADGIDNDGFGGGMLIVSSNPTIINCTFKGNFAIQGGGIYTVSNTSGDIHNSVFIGNEATQAGGAILLAGTSNINHCSFSGNRSLHPTIPNSSNGNAIRIFSLGAGSAILNSIFWGNGDPGTSDVILSSVNFNVFRCIVDLPNGAIYQGLGNRNADPLFVSQPTLLGVNGDLRLRTGSPAIDVIDANLSFIPTDHDGVERPVGFRADMGAFEYNP